MEMLLERSVRSGSLDYSYAPDGAVVICFTSGTTGKPKGVVISHTALIVQSLAKVAIVGYSEDDVRLSSRNVYTYIYCNLKDMIDEVYLHTTPLCHIGGLSSAMAMLMVGGRHVFIPKRKQTWKGGDYMKKILNGGGSLSLDLVKDATISFPRAKILSAYGMTETCSSLAFTTLFEPVHDESGTSLQTFAKTDSRPGKTRGVCVGKPAPHVEIKICFDDSSHVGKILTRGPHVMLRYWDQIPQGASSSTEESWLDTGDIGFIDDHGNLWLVGRTNGRIKSGGENVYPEEVEGVLLQHPGVISSIVVGIPDARLSEMVVACVRLRENWQWSNRSCEYSDESKEQVLSTEILRNHCREKNLSGYGSENFDYKSKDKF
ncbi:AMP-dependent synthetase/ligase [Corchorus olitorius]|uniref:AMP-dependent synthetase/ligase n=1 Tax=Corchorus olitorius TaxID=93759 RepID=A0A1R3HTV0_9ROSI|nr:AMP-dependent synthetase/ligase [Corchorus olitorius]